MEKGQAHELLNQVKLGMPVTQAQILQALYVTGDLDVQQITPRAGKSLCKDGLESCYVRSGEMEYEKFEGRSYWSMDWNRRRNSNETGGIEK